MELKQIGDESRSKQLKETQPLEWQRYVFCITHLRLSLEYNPASFCKFIARQHAGAHQLRRVLSRCTCGAASTRADRRPRKSEFLRSASGTLAQENAGIPTVRLHFSPEGLRHK